jgi:hypothetical protein
MEKQQAIELTRQMLQVAGTNRVRALFRKYNMNGVTPNVTGVITGLNLYGQAFGTDFLALVRDAVRARAKLDGPTDYGIPAGPTSDAGTIDLSGSGKSGGTTVLDWINDILVTGKTAGDTVGTWVNALSDNYTPITTTTANGQPIIITAPGQTADSGGTNTTLIIVAVVVLIVIIALVAFLTMRKK